MRCGLLLALVFCVSGAEFREALPAYRYSFPRDHFDHPAFRTEWWYYTGNVRDAAGKRFGFELVFFRQGQRRGASDNASVWRVDDLYLAHLALTEIDGQRFHYTERLNRAGPGIAGISFERRREWNGNWWAQWTGESQTLAAVSDDFRFNLHLDPAKPLVIHGENGVSQKAEGVGKASYYVSFPRLTVNGEITIGNSTHAVTGAAWMDHEWFTNQLDENQQGWDWFSVQLDDQTELMFFELRRKDGTIDRYSSGTYVDREGHGHHLTSKDFSVRPLEYWKRYPVKWQIEAPSLHLSLTCEAALRDQELRSAANTYWEGAVTYSGTRHGIGYLEMTGYVPLAHGRRATSSQIEDLH